MGKYDKDRRQKELAIRYCLAQGMVPCLEVVVPSISELSDNPEVITDIDALGLEFVADGGLRRIAFDCKSSTKLSAIGRTFWAAGLMQYTGCDGAFVILGKPAVYNHRISALSINVDLHDQKSFEDLGRSKLLDFDMPHHYQSTIDNWEKVSDAYDKCVWSKTAFEIARNTTPISRTPEKTFRKLVVELKRNRGYFDPRKNEHMAIFFDLMASMFILWTSMGRDFRRIYSPEMKQQQFEHALRFYVWGGKEAFEIRQALRERAVQLNSGAEIPADVQEFPAWEQLQHFVGLVVSAPQAVFGCVNLCRDLSIRCVVTKSADEEVNLANGVRGSNRATQFILAMGAYLVSACQLPSDTKEKLKEILAEL
ncbi:hypothetical protein [Falsigemmobacter faecalis]|uniref:Uncharacterized protein n=1 Tax=Falsigemmobacter faecalis TaxID=2488730 RepID=A0A3P3D3N8_9RHOB|nr:hypothetical protein [Falsigemmobacter faecalis]RRH69030.1 hypothetical protein EG244_18905 [Falsigemmobacter faecalis]